MAPLRPRVLMLPWLALGHILPYVELSRRLVQRGFDVFLCTTPANLSAIDASIRGSGIQTVPIHLSPVPGLPAGRESTGLIPNHLIPLLGRAFDESTPQFSTILRDTRPDCVVHDPLPWAVKAAAELRIPSIPLLVVGATCPSYIYFMWKRSQLIETGLDFPMDFDMNDNHDALSVRKMQELIGYDTKNVERMSMSKRMIQTIDPAGEIVAVKTHSAMERRFLDYFSNITGKNVVPVGLLLPQIDDRHHHPTCEFSSWLDRWSDSSVVYASLGSEYFPTKDEMREISLGLELSNSPFVWAVRFAEQEAGAKEMSLEEALPEGFLERVRERALVVKGWAPQLKILSHPAMGGFLSHCGWGAVCEAVGLGVPIVALSMHYEQPLSAKLLVDEMGVGVMVQREKEGEFNKEEVAKGIRRVMAEEEGREVRQKMKEMKERVERENEGELGVLVQEIEKFALKRNVKVRLPFDIV